MRNCTKCHTEIDNDKFCPSCGAVQVIKSQADVDLEAETQSLNTIKVAPSTRSNLPPTEMAAPTTRMQQPQSQGNNHWLVYLLVFAVTTMIGVGIGYGVLSKRRAQTDEQQIADNTKKDTKDNNKDQTGKIVFDDSDPNKTDKKDGKKPTPLPTPAPTPTPDTKIPIADGRDKPTPTPTPVPKPTPVISPKPTPPPIADPRPPVGNDLPESDNEPNDTDRSVLFVKFKVRGRAIVKVHGSDIDVLPDNGSTVSDVERNVVNPLPTEFSRVFVKQRSKDNATATLVDEPRPRNNFTATVLVESFDPNPSRAATINFAVKWHLPLFRR